MQTPALLVVFAAFVTCIVLAAYYAALPYATQRELRELVKRSWVRGLVIIALILCAVWLVMLPVSLS